MAKISGSGAQGLAAAGNIQKDSHPGGAPEAKLDFFVLICHQIRNVVRRIISTMYGRTCFFVNSNQLYREDEWNQDRTKPYRASLKQRKMKGIMYCIDFSQDCNFTLFILSKKCLPA